MTKRDVPYGLPYLKAMNTCLDEVDEFKGICPGGWVLKFRVDRYIKYA